MKHFKEFFLKKRSLENLRQEKGVALLMALMTLTLLMWISVELSYDTSVDYVVASNEVNEVKAYYAAKAGVELSLLRIHLYKQVMSSLGGSLPEEQRKMLDLIWSFPMMWPPQIPDDSKVTEVDKGLIQGVVGESLMDAQYIATISSEGGRIDVNDLGSEVKALADGTKQQLLNIFRTELDRNETFNKAYSGFDFEELLNNIADYVDADREGRNGGDESAPYRNLDLPDDVEAFPPNRSFITIDELHLVAGMTDDIYNLLESKVTVYGIKGFNVNQATKETLMALDPTMTEEAVTAVLKRINDPEEGGPFPSQNCKKSFLEFIGGYGVDTRALQESTLPFVCDAELNFRIQSDGVALRSKKTITVITYDLQNLVSRYTGMLQEQMKDPEETDAAQAGDGTDQGRGQTADSGKNEIKASKDRPSVVYWMEN